jgi:hypothetical protein
MNRDQAKSAGGDAKSSIEASAVKLMGGAKLRIHGKMDKAVGAAYRVFGGIKRAGSKGAGSKASAYKTASGLKY